MAAGGGEVVLLKSTLELRDRLYSVRLTSTEIYWEALASERAAGGPYSQPLVSKYSESCRDERGERLRGCSRSSIVTVSMPEI